MTSKVLRELTLGTVAILIVLYVGSYLVLSRRGFSEAKRNGFEGFYYFPVENTDRWKRNERFLGSAFAPLNYCERLLGSGMPHGCEPQFDLE